MPHIIIYNFNLGEWDSFDCPEEAVICLDRLTNNPCRVLMEKYKLDTKMKYLHFILPHIAKLFGVNRRELEGKWAQVFGVWECFKI